MYPCETETISDEQWEDYLHAEADWAALSPQEQDLLLEEALEDAAREREEEFAAMRREREWEERHAVIIAEREAARSIDEPPF